LKSELNLASLKPSNSLILGKTSLFNLVRKEYIEVLRRVTLQPTGFPFLIFKEILGILELVVLPFCDVINSSAIKVEPKSFNSVFLDPKFNTIFSNFGN